MATYGFNDDLSAPALIDTGGGGKIHTAALPGTYTPGPMDAYFESANQALSGVSDIVGNVNNIAQQWKNINKPSAVDAAGNVDLNAPGSKTTVSTNPFYDVTGQYTPGVAKSATDLYNQGVTDLNPWQVDAYNNVSDVAGTYDQLADQAVGAAGAFLDPNSEMNQYLAQKAANRVALGAGQAGTLGSDRYGLLAGRAALDSYYDNLGKGIEYAGTAGDLSRKGTDFLTEYGDKYYGFEDQAPWDHLNRYSSSIGYGQNVPSGSGTVTTSPSGVDTYNALTGKAIADAALAKVLSGEEIPTYSGPLANVQKGVDTVKNTVDTVGSIIDTGSKVYDIVSDWFGKG